MSLGGDAEIEPVADDSSIPLIKVSGLVAIAQVSCDARPLARCLSATFWVCLADGGSRARLDCGRARRDRVGRRRCDHHGQDQRQGGQEAHAQARRFQLRNRKAIRAPSSFASYVTVQIDVTLWGQQVDKVADSDIENNSLLLIKNAQVSDFSGTSIRCPSR